MRYSERLMATENSVEDRTRTTSFPRRFARRSRLCDWFDPRAVVVDQAFAGGERNRLRAAADAHLPEDPLDVRADRLRAQVQALRDLGLREPVHEESEDLELARRHSERVRFASLRPAVIRACEHPFEAGNQLVRVERLRKVVVRPDQQTCDAVERLRAVAGHEDDREVMADALPQL